MRRLVPSASLCLLLAQGALAASSVSLTTTALAPNLPLDGEGSSTQRIIKVADLHVTGDAPLGFTLIITSGSLGKSDGRTPIPFSVVTVSAGSPPPTAASFTTGPGEPHVFRSNVPGELHRELYIRYAALPLQDPGNYAHAVSVDVSDN